MNPCYVLGVQEVASSNLAGPTKVRLYGSTPKMGEAPTPRGSTLPPKDLSGVQMGSKTGWPAKPSREREMFCLIEYIVPQWGKLRLTTIIQ